jgi:hypothetical protein
MKTSPAELETAPAMPCSSLTTTASVTNPDTACTQSVGPGEGIFSTHDLGAEVSGAKNLVLPMFVP